MATERKRRTGKKRTRTSRRKTEAKSLMPQNSMPNSRLDIVKNSLKKKHTLRMAIIAAVLIVLGTFALKYRYFLVPATVNGQPIFAWDYVAKLHQLAGEQILNQLISERVILQEATKNSVSVSPEEFDTEVKKVEDQLTQSGGLDTFLISQSMSRKEFDSQMRLSLLVKKLVETEVSVSDDEINKEYTENATDYTDMDENQAKQKIQLNLREQKIQEEITPWLEGLKTNANIQILLPSK